MSHSQKSKKPQTKTGDSSQTSNPPIADCVPRPDPNDARRRPTAKDLRQAAFDADNPQPFPPHCNNCDEQKDDAAKLAFSKALKRRGSDLSDFGEPDPTAFANMLNALGQQGEAAFAAFEQLAIDDDLPVPGQNGLKLTNADPQELLCSGELFNGFQ